YYYVMELVRGRSVHEIINEARGNQDGSGPGQTETLLMDGSADASRQDGSEAGSTSQVPRSAAASGPDSARSSTASWTTVEHFDSIARLTATVAEALEYAHQAGVIHRDIKPHNLLLGDDGRLCISDFLARVLEQPGITMTGEFIGSPLYMSPEQIVGGARVDRRTDIYSLGATLYEWMTLSPPFPGPTREVVISQITTGEPHPPRSLNSKIPQDLETICLKAIAKDPNHRYAMAGEMASDLRRYLERDAIRARRAGPIARMGRYVQRHPVGALVAVLVLVVLLFGGAWYKQRSHSLDADAARQDAVAQVSQAKQQSEQAAETTKDMMEAVEGLSTLASAEQARRVEAYRQALGDFTRLGQEALGLRTPEGEAPLQGTLSDQLGDFSRQVADRLAADLMTAQLQAERQRLESTDPQIAPGSAEGYYLQAVSASEFEAALEFLDRALAIDSGYYDARYLRAVILCQLDRFDESIADAEKLIEARRESPRGFLLRGAGRLFLGQTESSRADLERCLNLGGESAWAHVLRGLSYAWPGDVGRAIQAYSRALDLSPDHVVALFARAEAQYSLGAYRAALLDVDRVVELFAESPESVEAYVLRGQCHDKLLQFHASIKDYNQAIKLGDTSVATGAKLILAMANAAKEQQLRESLASTAAQEGSPEASESEEERHRGPLHDGDDANWLNRWIRERMGGQKPPPEESPGVNGYPFRRLLPLYRAGRSS
ncbi:MAG: protein kinase domain-containing protein, partial [Planctomycetota bacterium]